jgi:N-acetylglucosaminyldiphosphoundecaprenol N-acetyl-beta-D-mannosaminyltransferase
MTNSFSKILGAKISNVINYREVYDTLKSSFNSSTSYITVNNVHTVIEAVRYNKYKEVINSSFLALPDGKPLSVYAKIKGARNITRIFGPTFFAKTLEWGQGDGLTHFFFGSSGETLSKMSEVIINKYPRAIIKGKLSPPFRQFTEAENEQFIKEIKDSNADIIWVGLGAPKQEMWIYENYKKLNRGVMIGIGAGFNYLAGDTKHAPEWMKNASLEWLYRLIQEPGRLWKRYLVTNTLFLWYIFLELTGLKKFN